MIEKNESINNVKKKMYYIKVIKEKIGVVKLILK